MSTITVFYPEYYVDVVTEMMEASTFKRPKPFYIEYRPTLS